MEAAPPPARRLDFLRSARAFWHPHIVLMLPLGFCMGMPLAWSFFILPVMLRQHELNGAFAALVLLSWVSTLNFFWASIFDKLRLPWLSRRLGRRRSWMLITHIATMAAIVILGIFGSSAHSGTVLLLVVVVAFASSSLRAVVDAYRVELLEESRYGAGDAVTEFGGGFLAAVTVLALTPTPGDMDEGTFAHLVAPGLLAVGVAVALFGPEPSHVPDIDAAARERRLGDTAARWGGAFAAWVSRVFVAPLTEFFTRPAWLAVLAFLFLFKLGAADGQLGSPIEAVGGVATFIGGVGIVAGAMAVYARGPLPGLLFAAILLLLTDLVLLVLYWASAEAVWIGLVVVARQFGDGFGTIAVAAYAMGLCRPSYTAAQFALFSSVMAVTQTVPGPPSWIAGLLPGGPGGLLVLATFASLLSLLLLRVLWNRQRREEVRP